MRQRRRRQRTFMFLCALTVSESWGLRSSLRKRMAKTGTMQIAVASAIVNHTTGCNNVLWALPVNTNTQIHKIRQRIEWLTEYYSAVNTFYPVLISAVFGCVFSLSYLTNLNLNKVTLNNRPQTLKHWETLDVLLLDELIFRINFIIVPSWVTWCSLVGLSGCTVVKPDLLCITVHHLSEWGRIYFTALHTLNFTIFSLLDIH